MTPLPVNTFLVVTKTPPQMNLPVFENRATFLEFEVDNELQKKFSQESKRAQTSGVTRVFIAQAQIKSSLCMGFFEFFSRHLGPIPRPPPLLCH